MVQKRGRPPLPPGEGKKVPLNMRTTRKVRDRLEAAAIDTGRSLTQEVEYRLQRSFEDEDAIFESFSGEHTYRLMKLLGAAVGVTENTTGKQWNQDAKTFASVEGTIDLILKALPFEEGAEETIYDDYLREFLEAISIQNLGWAQAITLLELTTDFARGFRSDEETLKALKAVKKRRNDFKILFKQQDQG